MFDTEVPYVSDCFQRSAHHVEGYIRFYRVVGPHLTVDIPLQLSCHLPEVEGSTSIGVRGDAIDYLTHNYTTDYPVDITLYDANLTQYTYVVR